MPLAQSIFEVDADNGLLTSKLHMKLNLPVYMWSTPWKEIAAGVWLFSLLVLVIAAAELLRSWLALNSARPPAFRGNNVPVALRGGVSWTGALQLLGGCICLALFLEYRAGTGDTWHERLVQFAWFIGLGAAILIPLWLTVTWIKYVPRPSSARAAYVRIAGSAFVILLFIRAGTLWIQRPLLGG
jgi:hypothetical protein